MRNSKQTLSIVFFILFAFLHTQAQNPFIQHLYSADPTARVFNGKVYVYPSHDILAVEGKGRPGWFCMEDYHVFSSPNLSEWTDHGVIVSQDKVPWTNPTAYAMWAPDCISRNGKYYFYFPAPAKDSIYGKGFSIGVAVADQPEGPFVPQDKPIIGVHGIDPNVFIDKDGQAYIYYAAQNIYVAKLKENMLELASEPVIIPNLPEKGLKEGPFLFERNGTYYLTYPHVQNRIERLEYATSNNPMGPFKQAGVIMDESPMNCWTNHQSFIEFNKQWYLFYHQNALNPKVDKTRAICVDSLSFNSDGSIKKVIPSLRGVGQTKASSKIQIDRYSEVSKNGVSVAFIDTAKRFDGWKTILSEKQAWTKYNSVAFEKEKYKTVKVNAQSATGGTIQIRLGSAKGTLLSEVKIPKGETWNVVSAKLENYKAGIQDLVVVLKTNMPVEIDWIQFGD